MSFQFSSHDHETEERPRPQDNEKQDEEYSSSEEEGDDASAYDRMVTKVQKRVRTTLKENKTGIYSKRQTTQENPLDLNVVRIRKHRNEVPMFQKPTKALINSTRCFFISK